MPDINYQTEADQYIKWLELIQDMSLKLYQVSSPEIDSYIQESVQELASFLGFDLGALLIIPEETYQKIPPLPYRLDRGNHNIIIF